MPIIFKAITAKQIRLELLERGVLDVVESAIAASGPRVKIIWEYSDVFNRFDPIILSIAKGLNKDEQWLDMLFLGAQAR